MIPAGMILIGLPFPQKTNVSFIDGVNTLLTIGLNMVGLVIMSPILIGTLIAGIVLSFLSGSD